MSRWDGAAAATWNRHLSALTSFTTWAQRQEILTTNPARRLERRKPARRGDRSISGARLDKLFTDDRHGLRERVRWRMLYETGEDFGPIRRAACPYSRVSCPGIVGVKSNPRAWRP